MELTDVVDKASLQTFLMKNVPGLAVSEDITESAFLLWRWLCERMAYPAPKTMLDHNGKPGHIVFRQVMERQAGVWCSGAAVLFACALDTVGIPSAVFSYGHHGQGVSHATTLFGVMPKGEPSEFYLLDAYLGYYYVDEDGRLMPFTRLLEKIATRRHDAIYMVEEEFCRPHITLAGEGVGDLWWLFENDPPQPQRNGPVDVYEGAVVTWFKLLESTVDELPTPLRALIDEQRDEQPLNEFLLDLMLIKPEFWFPSDDCGDCYPAKELLRSVVSGLAAVLKGD